MKRVLYNSPFVPAVWIRVHGFEPAHVLPSSSTDELREGVCPFGNAYLDAVNNDDSTDPVIFATTCDQMRRCFELVTDRPAFLLNVPPAWQSPASSRLYLDELRRLGRFLVQCGGAAPTDGDLANEIRRFEEHRQPAAGLLGAGLPLAVVGSHILKDDRVLFDWISAAGGRVAVNGTESGRGTCAPIDRRRLQTDPLGALADAHYPTIPDAFLRPNSRLHQWLKQEMIASDARGLIVFHYTWCDLWHAEVERFRLWCDVPTLAIQLNDELTSTGANRVRMKIQAFLEMLS